MNSFNFPKRISWHGLGLICFFYDVNSILVFFASKRKPG